MADRIEINTQTLLDTASSVRSIKNNLLDTLNTMKVSVNNLQATYESAAATALQDKIASVESKFSTYDQIVEEYAKFLERAAASWTETEDATTKNVGKVSEFI